MMPAGSELQTAPTTAACRKRKSEEMIFKAMDDEFVPLQELVSWVPRPARSSARSRARAPSGSRLL